VCGQAVSNAEGIATLPITGLPTSRIYAIAIDEWGKPFAPGMTVAYGDVIRPTQFLGWMYQVTSPGVLPGTEPEWWNSMAGVPQPVGTAMMQAVRHYQPIAHGPVSDIEWVEQEFDPYWDKVVALLHFDDPLEPWKDKTGRVWNYLGSSGVYELQPESAIFGGYGLRVNTPAGNQDQRRLASAGMLELTDAFTIEAFIRPRVSAFAAVLTQAGGGGDSDQRFSLDSELRIEYYKGGNASLGGGVVRLVGTTPLPMSEFSHVALVYDGERIMGFARGILQFSANRPYGWRNTAHPMLVANALVPGYAQYQPAQNIDLGGLRITEGVARYNEDFDPPTGPFPNIGPPL